MGLTCVRGLQQCLEQHTQQMCLATKCPAGGTREVALPVLVEATALWESVWVSWSVSGCCLVPPLPPQAAPEQVPVGEAQTMWSVGVG